MLWPMCLVQTIVSLASYSIVKRLNFRLLRDYRFAGTTIPAYGPRKCEKLARTEPDGAALNADSYTWFALTHWYYQYHGTVKASGFSSSSALDAYDVDTDDVTIIDVDDGPAEDIYPAEASAQPTATATLDEPATNPTHSTYPIYSPGCQTASTPRPVPPIFFQTENGIYNSYNLFYTMRRQICSNSCSRPDGIPRDVMVAAGDGNWCEISIGVSEDLEVYMYTGTPSQGAEWVGCWNATENIIESCIKGDSSKTGWSNGSELSIATSSTCR